MSASDAIVPDQTEFPPELPVPEDDGAADHLLGRPMPPGTLASTSGEVVSLDRRGRGQHPRGAGLRTQSRHFQSGGQR